MSRPRGARIPAQPTRDLPPVRPVIFTGSAGV